LCRIHAIGGGGDIGGRGLTVDDPLEMHDRAGDGAPVSSTTWPLIVAFRV